MATGELQRPKTIVPEVVTVSPPQWSARAAADWALSALASLRLTVTLFSMGIFLVFFGTLAQKDQDVWQVVNDTYFRVWFAQVDFLTFERLVQLFNKSVEWNLTGGFYFPGGKLIGLLLLVNLLAAHSIRFKIAAEGRRLAAGVATIAAGLVITAAVILSGNNQSVESQLSPAFCDLLWQFFRGSLVVLTLAGAYGLLFLGGRLRRAEWWVALTSLALLGALTVFLLANPQARLDDSGLRILWQLAKGTAAGIVLLVGCVLVFRKRGGIVLLHGGILLMMLTEMFTAMSAVESRMAIPEGQTVNFSSDIRTTELAVIDKSDPEHDHVTVIPASKLAKNVRRDAPLDHERLPFKIRVHRWLPNSALRDVRAGEPNPATAGFGLQHFAEEAATATGVGPSAQQVDSPSAYVELLSKETGRSLGTYLVANLYSMKGLDQPVEVDGRTYHLSLRYKRLYHPFSLTLHEFRFDRYPGTNTPKNYSSRVVFRDPSSNIDREVLIWMNNPLRYAGTTFYQSGFDEETEQVTVLQVVTNPSWMTPYVACMLVLTAMLAHFGMILVRFLRRRAEEAELEAARAFDSANGQPANGSASGLQHAGNGRAKKSRRSATPASTPWLTAAVLFPAAVVLVCGLYIASKTRMPSSSPSEMQIHEFGKLPLAYQGRIKPYDTLARNSLQILSGRQEVSTIDSQGKVTSREPAIRWLLDVISGHPRADDHPVFRIEDLDLIETLGLERRPMFWRYSLNEIEKKPGELSRQIELAEAIAERDRQPFHHKVLQLAGKRNFYSLIMLSFRSPPLTLDRGEEEFKSSLGQAQFLISRLRQANAPHAVPPTDLSTNWSILMQAEVEAVFNRILDQPVNEATIALSSMLAAHARDDVTTFNKQLADYRAHLAKYEQSLAENRTELLRNGAAKSEILSRAKVDFEVFYNHFSPFFYAQWLYFAAFLLGIFSWIGWSLPLRRASMWLLWFTVVLHTFALVARVYISGRPPVTNLYTTAIFIGWAAVLMSLIYESIYRLGLGNIAAAVIGFLTLVVAYNLSLDGDTFIVLQAVLDTQFWLATHVVTINLGYAATLMAGMWGALYVLGAHVVPVLGDEARHKLLRTLYGTLCFAIFFSFIGTVLGGLWADDSWGRFWGWDPKENGALIIVIWNALVLHARWGGLVKGLGFANLSIGGNIVTAWSWFGVNELNVGLHTYGASEKATAMWLLIFAASQLAIMALGMMPQRWFQALKLRRSQPSEA